MSDASIPAALRRRRDYAGPALFSYGFRPFFLGGAVWAALAIVLWLPQYFGELQLPTAFGPWMSSDLPSTHAKSCSTAVGRPAASVRSRRSPYLP